jgi:hypothetical protein
MLGRNVLGRYPLGTVGDQQSIIVDWIFFEHELVQVQPTQLHFVGLNNMSLELSFAVPIPSQVQRAEIDDIAIEHAFPALLPSQNHNPSINSLTIEHEFQAVNIFVAEMDFDLEFETISPSQVHNISSINDFTIENEFEQCLAVQVHGINSISNMTFSNYFDAPDIAQVHIVKPKDVQFDLSFNKIFPETIMGGYMFVTVNDNGTEYKLSFEGIESE